MNEKIESKWGEESKKVDFVEIGREMREKENIDRYIIGSRIKMIKLWYIHIPIPQDECKYYVLQT